MKKLFLVRYGEIALKGLNKNYFVDTLVRNIKYALRMFEEVKVEKIQGRVAVYNVADDIESEVISSLTKVFGIVAITRAVQTASDMEHIYQAAGEVMKDIRGNTFKVESRRGDKSFPLTSPEISSMVGSYLLDKYPSLKVDVHKPEITIGVEVRKETYITYGDIPGQKGMPMGTAGRGGVLLSGGIDSPVAAYMMARRGMKVTGIHFHSYPFTSLDAQRKVEDIGKILSLYNNGFEIAMISLTEIQQEIIKNCDESYLTVILRRFMIKCARLYAEKNGLGALITGESLGQVASQTMESIICTDQAADIPVFRPLIGTDKDDIIKIAQSIGTYEISIKPFEDCCTVFVPKHPQTRPVLEKVLYQESRLPAPELIAKAMENIEIIKL
ncbi:MAG: tRNA 4-thiouridine(8) synthase ThiI [Eubacteriaceae bacterium]|nr:tRNA 4-thiouridine(8) synthase ThiI [Eubacteriaceae bacterium]